MLMVKLDYDERLALQTAVQGWHKAEDRIKRVGAAILKRRGEPNGRFEIVDLRKGLISIERSESCDSQSLDLKERNASIERDVAGIDPVVESAADEVACDEARDGSVGRVPEDLGEAGERGEREHPAHD